MPVKEQYNPDPTPDTTFTVWIHPEKNEDRKPLKFTGIVDVLKLPTGVVKVATHDGVVQERYGEVIRMRQEGLPDN